MSQKQARKAVTTGEKRRSERLQVMLEPEELDAIDAWKFDNRLPTRAAAIRELLRRGLMSKASGTTIEPGRASSRSFGVLRRQ